MFNKRNIFKYLVKKILFSKEFIDFKDLYSSREIKNDYNNYYLLSFIFKKKKKIKVTFSDKCLMKSMPGKLKL